MKAWEVDRLQFAVKVYPGEEPPKRRSSGRLILLAAPDAIYFDRNGSLVARQWFLAKSLHRRLWLQLRRRIRKTGQEIVELSKSNINNIKHKPHK